MSRPRAWVTGASRGIGRAAAIALAQAGHDVVVSARTVRPGEVRDNAISVHRPDERPLPGSLEETASEVKAAGGEALLVPFDLTDRAAVSAAAQTVLDAWGGVDVLVHNGRWIGPGLMDVFLETPLDSYEKMVEAHGIAPILLTRAILPGMLERGGGTVVTVTSSAAYDIPPAAPGKGGWGHAYAVGKAAGHQLVPQLHAEFFGHGIRAVNVEPGFVATERNLIVVADFGFDASHGAPPEALGAVVAWLATAPEAAELGGTTVAGQELCLERGLHADWRQQVQV